jgi:hypothetical protein
LATTTNNLHGHCDLDFGGLSLAFLVILIVCDLLSHDPHLPFPLSWLQLLMTFLVIMILILVVRVLHILCLQLLVILLIVVLVAVIGDFWLWSSL